MYQIDANTKISALIKANPEAIDVIASINDHFKKLYNPILRKILASRVTISEAARIGKVDIAIFFERLKPLGFTVKETLAANEIKSEANRDIQYDKVLDVREDIASGNDPFRKIMQELNKLSKSQTLLLINSFEPVPLIRILNDRGYEVTISNISDELVHTFITRKDLIPQEEQIQAASDFDAVLKCFEGKLSRTDVRSLPMPQPMMTILKQLETLAPDHALFVVHKKLPLFLLPELEERGFSCVHKRVPDGVHLIIYRH